MSSSSCKLSRVFLKVTKLVCHDGDQQMRDCNMMDKVSLENIDVSFARIQVAISTIASQYGAKRQAFQLSPCSFSDGHRFTLGMSLSLLLHLNSQHCFSKYKHKWSPLR